MPLNLADGVMHDQFSEALKAQLAPALRADQFRGSGRNFRRTRGQFIHVLNIEESKSGHACCVNLGVHLDFLPAVGRQAPVDPKRVVETDCEFRSRMAPAGHEDHWWPYGTSLRETEESVADMVRVYLDSGRRHFERVSTFPQPFDAISPEQLEAGDLSLFPGAISLVRACLIMARISVYCGQPDRANRFARLGLMQPGGGVGLRAKLEALAGAG